MQDHQSFSLSTILNSRRVEKQFYQQMIHQIKSPLQEQSFPNHNYNQMFLDKVPKRPKIPPPPQRSPFSHKGNDQINQFIYKQSLPHLMPKNFDQKILDLTVEQKQSPLQLPKQIRQNEPIQPFYMCGCFKKQHQPQIQVEILPTNKKPQYLINSKSPYRKPVKSLNEAISSLMEIQYFELAFFLQLLGQLQVELVQIDKQKIQLQNNMESVYGKLSTFTQYTPQDILNSQNYTKVLRRLKSQNSTQALQKILGRRPTRQKQAEKHIQKLFGNLDKIQIIISVYTKKNSFFQNLSLVYDFLEHNFSSCQSLKGQIEKLYDSLNIHLSTVGLDLIWKKFDERKLTKDQFIHDLVLNDYITRPKNNSYEYDLILNGYNRNT